MSEITQNTLVAEHRSSSPDLESQLLLWSQYVKQDLEQRHATGPRGGLERVELNVKKRQYEWVSGFLTTDFDQQLSVHPRLPIAHLFLDEQAPVITAVWGRAAPTCAVVLLFNESPSTPEALTKQLAGCEKFFRAGPPGCAVVAIYSAITRLETGFFDRPETFTIEDPAASIRAVLSCEHANYARRYYAGKYPLPVAVLAVGNGPLHPRQITPQMKKREFARRPYPNMTLKDTFSIPLSHFTPALWRRLTQFCELTELSELARVRELVEDFHHKQQFLQGIGPGALKEFPARTRRELMFTLGWPEEIVEASIREGDAVVQREFLAWREHVAEEESRILGEKEKVVHRLSTRRRKHGIAGGGKDRALRVKPEDRNP